MPIPEKIDDLVLKLFMHPPLRAKFWGFLLVLAYECLMQKKRFSEPKNKYYKVLKMSVKIPASGKNSSVVFFIWSIKRYLSRDEAPRTSA